MAIPTNSYDETKPAGTRDINLGDDDIREMKTQIREIIEVDHKMASTGQGTDWGYHNWVTHLVQVTVAAIANAFRTYSKDVAGKAELHGKDEDGNEIQITNAGGLNAPALKGALPAISGAALTGIVAVPSGGIILWSGTVAAIAAMAPNWYLCDGNNSTPDLRDKFVVGAGSTYAVGATGGEATHVLTTPEMPAHTHNITTYGGAADTNIYRNGASTAGSYATGSTGGGGAHENRPPYFALAYIMKS